MKNLILSILFISLIPGIFYAQEAEKHRNLSNDVAIHGYDPVAYFEQGKGIEGKKEFSATVDGTVYYCSSAENRELLLKNPDTYLPQYGGWCAYAMGDYGEKVDVNPKTFKITNGKLYLFYNSFPTNTLKSWNKDEMNLAQNADQNWKKITTSKNPKK
ncbi:YHS domain-containing (seleno)protein [Sinomicrobium sp. M5D2P17]